MYFYNLLVIVVLPKIPGAGDDCLTIIFRGCTMSINIGIDLGTASIIIYTKNDGVILNEPSVAAVDRRTDKIVLIGQEANKVVGKTPGHIEIVKPLEDGVISNYRRTREMVQYFIEKACGNRIIKPKVAICVPAGVTNVESRAVVDAANAAGVRDIYLVEEPVAAALGAGIDLSRPDGKLILDIGGGTADVAVLSLNGVVAKDSIKVGGQKFDQALIRHIRNAHGVLIGEKTAENAKIAIGSVHDISEEVVYTVKGRHIGTGLPKSIEINQAEISTALFEYVHPIARMMQSILEITPPELVADISDSGIILTGGGSMLRGMPEYLTSLLNVNTVLVDEPLLCVARGTGLFYDHLDKLTDGIINGTKYY